MSWRMRSSGDGSPAVSLATRCLRALDLRPLQSFLHDPILEQRRRGLALLGRGEQSQAALAAAR